jgi:hypothetical protein
MICCVWSSCRCVCVCVCVCTLQCSIVVDWLILYCTCTYLNVNVGMWLLSCQTLNSLHHIRYIIYRSWCTVICTIWVFVLSITCVLLHSSAVRSRVMYCTHCYAMRKMHWRVSGRISQLPHISGMVAWKVAMSKTDEKTLEGYILYHDSIWWLYDIMLLTLQ